MLSDCATLITPRRPPSSDPSSAPMEAPCNDERLLYALSSFAANFSDEGSSFKFVVEDEVPSAAKDTPTREAVQVFDAASNHIDTWQLSRCGESVCVSNESGAYTSFTFGSDRQTGETSGATSSDRPASPEAP